MRDADRSTETGLCPIQGCRVHVPSHLPMCWRHWAAVPPVLKRLVQRTRTERQERPTDVACRQAHEDAKRRAIVAVALPAGGK